MKIIGLTGSIASGKSSVSLFIKTLNIPVIDCDLIAHGVVRKVSFFQEKSDHNQIDLKSFHHTHTQGCWGYRRVLHAFYTADILQPDGELDREALAAIVFNDPAARRRLNGATHLPVLLEILQSLLLHWMCFTPIVVIDMPLLFETGFYKVTRPNNILVQCSPNTQLKRLMARDNMSQEAAEARIASQMAVTRKRALADVIIDNDGSFEDLEKKVVEVARQLQERGSVWHRAVFSPVGVGILVAAFIGILWKALK